VRQAFPVQLEPQLLVHAVEPQFPLEHAVFPHIVLQVATPHVPLHALPHNEEHPPPQAL